MELQPNYVAPSELGEKPGSAFTVPADDNGTFGARSSQLRQASVALTPADGPPGTVTIADGSGFTPNQPVTVTQSEGLIATGGSTTIRADQSGSITMTFRIADQTPPGVINVTFVQEDNTATAQFRVRRAASGTGGASTQPIKGTIDEFTQWLNACVNGRLNIPMCTTGGWRPAVTVSDPMRAFCVNANLPHDSILKCVDVCRLSLCSTSARVCRSMQTSRAPSANKCRSVTQSAHLQGG